DRLRNLINPRPLAIAVNREHLAITAGELIDRLRRRRIQDRVRHPIQYILRDLDTSADQTTRDSPGDRLRVGAGNEVEDQCRPIQHMMLRERLLILTVNVEGGDDLQILCVTRSEEHSLNSS